MREAQGERARDAPVISHFARGVLLQWSDGECSAAQVQRHADNCWRDGLRHPTVGRLRGVGEDQNAQRGVKTLLEDVAGLVSLQTVVETPDKVTRIGWGIYSGGQCESFYQS